MHGVWLTLGGCLMCAFERGMCVRGSRTTVVVAGAVGLRSVCVHTGQPSCRLGGRARLFADVALLRLSSAAHAAELVLNKHVGC